MIANSRFRLSKKHLLLLGVFILGGLFTYKDHTLQQENATIESKSQTKLDLEFFILKKTATTHEGQNFLKLVLENDKIKIADFRSRLTNIGSPTPDQLALLALSNLLLARHAESPLDKLNFVNQAIEASTGAVRQAPENLFTRASRYFIHKKLPSSFADEGLINEDSLKLKDLVKEGVPQ